MIGQTHNCRVKKVRVRATVLEKDLDAQVIWAFGCRLERLARENGFNAAMKKV